MSRLDDRNIESLNTYIFVQDQTQYVGMEGAIGPLPLPAIKVGLELLDVPRDEWLEVLQRVRILHAAWAKHNTDEKRREKNTPSRRNRPAKEAQPREMMALPFAKKREI